MDTLEVYLDAIRRNDTDAENKRLRTIRSRVKECLAYFLGRDIQALTDADFEAWRLHLTATKPGNKKGTLMSDKTSNDYVTTVKDYIDWLAGQAGQLIIPLADQKGDTGNMNEDKVIESEVVESEPSAETPTRGRPGRKPNPDKADRVQVSIYIPRGVYEDIKDIAAFSNSNISDIACELIKEYTLSRSEMLKQARTFLQTLNFR